MGRMVAHAVHAHLKLHPFHDPIPEEFMPRFAFIVLAVALAACRLPQAEVSEQSVQFVSPSSPDSALTRVAAELTQLGFAIGGREENLVFTAPTPLPAGAGEGGREQLWFVHVVSNARLFRGGTDTRVRGFLVPQTGDVSPGNIVQEKALQITADRPAAFREVQRVAERLHAAVIR